MASLRSSPTSVSRLHSLVQHLRTQTLTRQFCHQSIFSSEPFCLTAMGNKSHARLLIRETPGTGVAAGIHTTAVAWKKSYTEALEGPNHWLTYNDVRLKPQEPDEPRRPAQVFHQRAQIRYSELKLWYVSTMIRGLSIDEALKQLTFCTKKGAHIVKEILLEAQEMALRDHNFEFKSKMWVAEAFATKGVFVKGIRRHARARYHQVDYNFNHFFVKLEEGDPPSKDVLYPEKAKLTMHQQIDGYLTRMRARKIPNSL